MSTAVRCRAAIKKPGSGSFRLQCGNPVDPNRPDGMCRDGDSENHQAWVRARSAAGLSITPPATSSPALGGLDDLVSELTALYVDGSVRAVVVIDGDGYGHCPGCGSTNWTADLLEVLNEVPAHVGEGDDASVCRDCELVFFHEGKAAPSDGLPDEEPAARRRAS